MSPKPQARHGWWVDIQGSLQTPGSPPREQLKCCACNPCARNRPLHRHQRPMRRSTSGAEAPSVDITANGCQTRGYASYHAPPNLQRPTSPERGMWSCTCTTQRDMRDSQRSTVWKSTNRRFIREDRFIQEGLEAPGPFYPREPWKPR